MLRADNKTAIEFARTVVQEKNAEAEQTAGFHGRLLLELVYVNNKIVAVESSLKQQRKF